ncbi:MAG: efflux RND transporter periplasmic adaptor subunit [Chloroflexota bacterium]
MQKKIDDPMNKRSISFVFIIITAAAGFAGYRSLAAEKMAADVPAAETVVVRRGDISINVEAAGSLAPSAEFTPAFPVAGRIYEMAVVEGQAVKQGDVLARLEGNIQAEADFRDLFSDAGVIQAELAVLNATDKVNHAIDDVAYLIGLDAWWWEKQLDHAEEKLAALDQDPHGTPEQITAAKREVELARGWRDYYRELYILKLESETYRLYDKPAMPGNPKPPPGARLPKRSYTIVQVEISDAELALVYANLEDAKVAFQDAQAALEIVRSGPSALQAPLAALGPETARLEQTRLNLDNSRLLAPADGAVTIVFFQTGEYANPGAPVMVISDVSALEAEVKLDEADVSRVWVGMLVVVTVDAFPGLELSGEVTNVAFTPEVQSGVVLYPVTVLLDETVLSLRAGMTVNVAFPIEQSSDTLIVPLRSVETEGGRAFVTRVTASGSERVAVTLGLITDTQVEILGGLEEGDVVMVFANPTQDTWLMSSPIFGGGQ